MKISKKAYTYCICVLLLSCSVSRVSKHNELISVPPKKINVCDLMSDKQFCDSIKNMGQKMLDRLLFRAGFWKSFGTEPSFTPAIKPQCLEEAHECTLEMTKALPIKLNLEKIKNTGMAGAGLMDSNQLKESMILSNNGYRFFIYFRGCYEGYLELTKRETDGSPSYAIGFNEGGNWIPDYKYAITKSNKIYTLDYPNFHLVCYEDSDGEIYIINPYLSGDNKIEKMCKFVNRELLTHFKQYSGTTIIYNGL